MKASDSGGYQGSTGYGSVPVTLSYYQAPSVETYKCSPQAGGY